MDAIKRAEKIIEWLKYKGIISTKRDLAIQMSYTESSLSQILNRKVPLTERFISKLSDMSPEINKDWILTGEGEMLKQEGKVTMTATWEGYVNVLQETKKTLSDILQEQKEIIQQLRNIISDKDQTITALRSEIENLKNK